MSRPSAILMGSKAGSIVALSIMLRRGWSVRAVVDSTKAPYLDGPTLADYARERGIVVVDKQSELAGRPVDFVISYMFRRLVTAPVRALASRGALNFHAGSLPEFAGWAFYNVAILENASSYGCTCHYMDDGFDTGPLLRVRRFPIEPSNETAVSLERRAQAEMVRLFGEFCQLAESGAALPREQQDPRRHRYLDRAQFDALKQIPQNADDEMIQRYARAFWYPPYRGATVKLGDRTVEVVPALAREQLGSLLHERDFERLMRIAEVDAEERAAA